MSGSFHLKTATNGQYHFTLLATNGQVILSSELYKEKASALKGIESIRRFGIDVNRFEKLVSAAGQPFFVLKASNGQVIGNSQMYSSELTRDDGIQSCLAHLQGADLIDESVPTSSGPKRLPPQ